MSLFAGIPVEQKIYFGPNIRALLPDTECHGGFLRRGIGETKGPGGPNSGIHKIRDIRSGQITRPETDIKDSFTRQIIFHFSHELGIIQGRQLIVGNDSICSRN